MQTIEDKARSIFLAALDRPPDEWPAILAQAGDGDDSVRARVDELLRAHHAMGSIAGGAADAPLSPIGPYRLLEQIGEGGFGVVYLAEQERPVRRRVALKIIKPGMDTREVIGRFEAERQALAMMDHPCIAKVFDAGMVGPVCRTGPDLPPGPAPSDPARQAGPTGRPYFVMELVQGVPISEYCDQCQLSTRERLELFVTVCQAVQHAHQKGIIHRDLKPTNVLVAIQDGKAAPKIIDFGVAKAIGDVPLTERTLTTAFAQMVGTPLYMSPEQAELSPLGVDTRSDIYSLGVLLYELLTGATPFEKERLHAASYDELRRIIREEEPPRPSARISTLAADLATTIAERRRTDARRLRQTIGGELDWIAMKCLEKDRNRRYESAGGLARDIERYLTNEPVHAYPPSVVYRLQKFIRRNRFAAAFVLLLVSAVAALAVTNVQSHRSEQRAITEKAKAQAVSNLLQEMLRSADPSQAKDVEYTVRQLLDDFSARFGSGLPEQPEVEAALRATIGRAYWRLAATEQADLHLSKALELRRNLFGSTHEAVAESLVDMAWCRSEQGRYSEAETDAREARQVFRKLGTNDLSAIRASLVLQHVLNLSHRYDEAQAVASEALAFAQSHGIESSDIATILHHQAEAFTQQGRYPDAEVAARRAVEMHRRLHGPRHPETAWGLRALGDALQQQKKLAEAKAAYREALEIFRERFGSNHFSLEDTSGHLKSVLIELGDESALEALKEEKVDRAESANDDLRVAELLVADGTKGKADEARRLVLRAMEGFAKVKAEYPDDLDRRVRAVDGYAIAVGPCAASPELKREFDKLHHTLTDELPALLAAFPNSRECQWWTAIIYRGWAKELLPYSEHLPQAEQNYRQSITLLEQLKKSDPNRPQMGLFLGDTYALLGDVQWRLNELADAEASFRQSMTAFNDRAAELATETDSYNQFGVVMDLLRFASFLAATERRDEAEQIVDKAVEALSRIDDPTLTSDAQFLLANVQLQLGDEEGYRNACATLSSLPADTTDDNVRFRRIWVWCLAPHPGKDLSGLIEGAEDFAKSNSLAARHMDLVLLGAIYFRAGQYEQAAGYLSKSIDQYPADPPVGHGATFFPQLFLAMTKWQQGRHNEARKLLAAAQPAIDTFRETPKAIWYGHGQFESLRREAEGMIGPTEGEDPVERRTPASVEAK